MDEPKASRTVVVTNDQGLHARAAMLVAELVRQYQSEVVLTKNGERVGTEVLQILSLGVGQGEQLLIEATGLDAENVLEAVAELFASNFGEDTQKTEKTEH